MLTVFNYCSNMLETQEYRDVALEHVVEICREECEREKAKSRMLPACISHCNGQVCLKYDFSESISIFQWLPVLG